MASFHHRDDFQLHTIFIHFRSWGKKCFPALSWGHVGGFKIGILRLSGWCSAPSLLFTGSSFFVRKNAISITHVLITKHGPVIITKEVNAGGIHAVKPLLHPSCHVSPTIHATSTCRWHIFQVRTQFTTSKWDFTEQFPLHSWNPETATWRPGIFM